MVIWGIDNSINGTGLCVMKVDGAKISEVQFHGFSKKRHYIDKTEVVFKENNVEVSHLSKDYVELPYHRRAVYIASFLLERYPKPDYVFFEDYAISNGKKSNNLTYVAEFCGGLKEYFYNLDIPYIVYVPSEIKLFATDNGNADKTKMGDTFISAGVRAKYIESKKFDKLEDYESPKGDIIDAFWIAALGRYHTLLKLNEHGDLPALSSKKAAMFSPKKDKKQALIARPFVRKVTNE